MSLQVQVQMGNHTQIGALQKRLGREMSDQVEVSRQVQEVVDRVAAEALQREAPAFGPSCSLLEHSGADRQPTFVAHSSAVFVIRVGQTSPPNGVCRSASS